MRARVRHSVIRVVSGGQTGVDRGALDAAIELGIGHGGWCPRGRLAEDGQIPGRYRLSETTSGEYRVRTEQNVVDSDATLILFRDDLSGGTDLTYRLAAKHGRPHYLVDFANDEAIDKVREWLAKNGVQTLNVAGPRESSAPGICEQAREFVIELLR